MSNVRRFGAAGDGVADDSDAIQHAVQDGDGMLHFSPGTYRITRPIEMALTDVGPVGIDGTGGTARIVMDGPGPAIRLTGTHGGTGSPQSVQGNVYPDQRLPTVRNIEIEGQHEQADGIQLIQTMQCVVKGVLIRRCRHGIHLTDRNRNVSINHCHIYHNTGAGIYLEGVNLHQINIVGCHISYNRIGGIRVERSEVRNLQITGNDIEYNNHIQHNSPPEPTAEIYVDTTADGASVNEVTIASNTIQAKPTPGGANIRIHERPGSEDRPPGLWSITGNIVGSQENNIHITGGYGIAISGNNIYSCALRNLWIEDSSQLTVGSNVFRRHTPNLNTGVRLDRSQDIVFTGNSILDEDAQGQASGASLLELDGCERINISSNQFTGGVPCAVDAAGCRGINLNGNSFHDFRSPVKSQHAVRFKAPGSGNLITGNLMGPTAAAALSLDDKSGVTEHGNLTNSEQ